MSLIRFIILDVDARDKRGHDESNIARIGISATFEPEVRAHRAANAIANFGFKGALES